ncbi:MAG TPA: YkgJ family cysteine cluster protein [Methylomirabilota bacterium]|nr:YkgJ family cysteine cluster protein [Methylomirabilota bacterium]
MSPDDQSIISRLCLRCGICCRGTLFKDVELQPGDDPARLAQLGLPLTKRRRGVLFAQPCAALGADCRCRIYADRPRRCRQFDCDLLQSVMAGKTELAVARRIIRRARRQAKTVERELAALGGDDSSAPLPSRFRRLKRRLESGAYDQETARRFADLTVAFHELMLSLREFFYAGRDRG